VCRKKRAGIEVRACDMTDFTVRESRVLSIPRSGVRVRVSPAAALGVSAVALGMALQVNFGQYDPAALGYLAIGICAAVFGAAGVARGRVSTGGVMPVLGVGLGLQFVILLCSNPMATLQVRSPGELRVFRLGVMGAAGLLLLALRGGRGRRARVDGASGGTAGLGFDSPEADAFLVGAQFCTRPNCPTSRADTGVRPYETSTFGRTQRRVAWWGVLVTHFLLGLWVLRVMPQPGVDVCLFQREASGALLGGHNPYAMSFPNLYPGAARVYGAGTYSGDRLLFGFPYPPLSLLMVLPGELLGDFRLSHLLATTLAGALIAASRPGRVATAAGALFLFMPRGSSCWKRGGRSRWRW
jgi:hypothetical protein